jgi:septal ring factor EnvC (AmiA/AmiB activator)
MIANLLESDGMLDRSRPEFPWLLVAASVILAALLAYVMFAGYLPARQRVVRLESELSDLYRREADLQTRLAQQEQRHAVREQQVAALTAERDALVRRLERLKRELAAARATRTR